MANQEEFAIGNKVLLETRARFKDRIIEFAVDKIKGTCLEKNTLPS